MTPSIIPSLTQPDDQPAIVAPQGLHVAIIMDGNGRWASSRGRPRTFGHAEGARAVRRVVRAAPDLGIGTLTLYAFSSDNWKRPPAEVKTLMRLFNRHLRSESAELAENGVRLRVVGRLDRLSPRVVRAVEDAEETTADGRRLLLRLAIDYSARDGLTRAAQTARGRRGQPLDRDGFAALIGTATRDCARDVDLLVRTGGEQRLSDFLLWEAAYAELLFTPVMWPDFGADELAAAVGEFHRRDRRFGCVEQDANGNGELRPAVGMK
jgi:undecaprenyl diphosphate synthase